MEKLKIQGRKAKVHYTPVKAIVNISNHQLTTSEESVLNNGLNFAMTIKWIPYLDLIALIKEPTLKIHKAQADELRFKVRQALEKSKLLKSNISKEERIALKSLQTDENVNPISRQRQCYRSNGKVGILQQIADLIGNGVYCKVKTQHWRWEGSCQSSLVRTYMYPSKDS